MILLAIEYFYFYHHSTTVLTSLHPPPLSIGIFLLQRTTARRPCSSRSITPPQTLRSSFTYQCHSPPIVFHSSTGSPSIPTIHCATLPHKIESQIPSRLRDERSKSIARYRR